MAFNILNKSAKTRTAGDITKLLICFENVKFFKDIRSKQTEAVLENLLRYMNYFHFFANEIVFEKGKVGRHFYVILSGSVEVLLPLENSAGVLENKVLRVLHSGDEFGELALLDNKPRTATIRCLEETHLAALDKIHFIRILSFLYKSEDYESQKVSKEIQFITSLPIFNSLNYSIKKIIYYTSLKIDLVRGQYVYHEGDQSEFFYIVMDGILEVYKDVVITERENFETLLRKAEYGFEEKHNYTSQKIAQLKAGECFGEVELLENSNRFYSVVCFTEKAKILKLPKVDFHRLIMANKDMRDLFIKNIEIREWLRNQRIDTFRSSKIDYFINPTLRGDFLNDNNGSKTSRTELSEDRGSNSSLPPMRKYLNKPKKIRKKEELTIFKLLSSFEKQKKDMKKKITTQHNDYLQEQLTSYYEYNFLVHLDKSEKNVKTLPNSQSQRDSSEQKSSKNKLEMKQNKAFRNYFEKATKNEKFQTTKKDYKLRLEFLEDNNNARLLS